MKNTDEEKELKRKRQVRRQVDLEIGYEPYKTKVHKNKKNYTRKTKHKNKKDY